MMSALPPTPDMGELQPTSEGPLPDSCIAQDPKRLMVSRSHWPSGLGAEPNLGRGELLGLVPTSLPIQQLTSLSSPRVTSARRLVSRSTHIVFVLAHSIARQIAPAVVVPDKSRAYSKVVITFAFINSSASAPNSAAAPLRTVRKLSTLAPPRSSAPLRFSRGALRSPSHGPTQHSG
jgi:hypothetical protein